MNDINTPLLCASARRYEARLLEALREAAGDSVRIEMLPTEEEVAWRLREGECDAALVSPLVYAADQSEYILLPGGCVAAVSATDDLLLTFNPGLHHFGTVGAVGVAAADRMLCEIVLREKYGMSPEFRDAQGSVDEVLAWADAVLEAREAAKQSSAIENTLDVIDEWFDMTQLPYVRSVIAARESAVTDSLAKIVETAGTRADLEVLEYLKSRLEEQFSPDERHVLPGHYRYVFDDAAREGLNEFFRLAFFYGLHRDVPLLNMPG
jgi:predicted solute-binding protein